MMIEICLNNDPFHHNNHTRPLYQPSICHPIIFVLLFVQLCYCGIEPHCKHNNWDFTPIQSSIRPTNHIETIKPIMWT